MTSRGSSATAFSCLSCKLYKTRQLAGTAARRQRHTKDKCMMRISFPKWIAYWQASLIVLFTWQWQHTKMAKWIIITSHVVESLGMGMLPVQKLINHFSSTPMASRIASATVPGWLTCELYRTRHLAGTAALRQRQTKDKYLARKSLAALETYWQASLCILVTWQKPHVMLATWIGIKTRVALALGLDLLSAQKWIICVLLAPRASRVFPAMAAVWFICKLYKTRQTTGTTAGRQRQTKDKYLAKVPLADLITYWQASLITWRHRYLATIGQNGEQMLQTPLFAFPWILLSSWRRSQPDMSSSSAARLRFGFAWRSWRNSPSVLFSWWLCWLMACWKDDSSSVLTVAMAACICIWFCCSLFAPA